MGTKLELRPEVIMRQAEGYVKYLAHWKAMQEEMKTKIWYMSTFKTLYRIGFNILLEHGISPETCYVNFQIIERDCPPGALITLKRAYGLDPTDTCPLRKE